MDVSLVSPTSTVFVPRQVAEYVDTNASARVRSRLLPNEGQHLRRSNMKKPSTPFKRRWATFGKCCQPFTKICTGAGLAAQFGDLLHGLHGYGLQVFEYAQLLLHRLNRQRRLGGDALGDFQGGGF